MSGTEKPTTPTPFRFAVAWAFREHGNMPTSSWLSRATTERKARAEFRAYMKRVYGAYVAYRLFYVLPYREPA